MIKKHHLTALKFRAEELRSKNGDSLQRPLEDYIKATVQWLIRAQEATSDDGVAEGYHASVQRWGPSYPETTGYIICSLLRADRMNMSEAVNLRQAAQKMGLWLVSTQLESGAFPGGNIQVVDPQPAVFNTGQIIKGLTDLIKNGLDIDDILLNAANKAAHWMVQVQDTDGAWRKGISKLTTESVHAYNIRAAWGLARHGRLIQEPTFVEAGKRNAEWLFNLQAEDSWYPHMNFDVGGKPLTHTIAYTIRGMLELGLICDDSRLVGSAVKAADRMLFTQDVDEGSLPGQYSTNFTPAVDWTSTTGNSQMAIIWFTIADLLSDEAWRIAAEKANHFNCSIQEYDMEHSESGRKGGLRGSVPGHKGYGKYWYMNWTQKFHLDALLAQMGQRID